MGKTPGRKSKYFDELPSWFNKEYYAYPRFDENGEFKLTELVEFWYWQIRARTRLQTKIERDEIDLQEVLNNVPDAVENSIYELEKKLKNSKRRNIYNDDSDGRAVKELRVRDMIYLGDGLTKEESELLYRRSLSKHNRVVHEHLLNSRKQIAKEIEELTEQMGEEPNPVDPEALDRPIRHDYSGTWDRLYSDPVFFAVDMNMDRDTILSQFKALVDSIKEEKADKKLKLKTLKPEELRKWTFMKYNMMWDLLFWLQHTHPHKEYSGEFFITNGYTSIQEEVIDVYLSKDGKELRNAGPSIKSTHLSNIPTVFSPKTISKLVEKYQELTDEQTDEQT